MNIFEQGDVEFKITFTTRCSGNCSTCLNPNISKHYSLERDLFERLIKEIIDLDVPNRKIVSFYGIGESYLHPSYIEMCEWAIPLLHESKIKTMLVTNGTHIHTVPRGIDKYIISFNAGKKETYENVTGMRFDLVYGNIMNLYEQGEFEKANEVQIHMLCFDKNEGEEENFLSLFKGMKGVKYRLRYGYDNQYGNTDNRGRIQQYSKGIDRIPCTYVTNIVTVYPNGDVVRCCHDFFDEYPYGNLNSNKLMDILSSDERKRILKLHKEGTFLEICEKCDLNRKTLRDEFVFGYFDEDENEIYQLQRNQSSYLPKLMNSCDELKEQIENKTILLWGLGKRGKAFVELCEKCGIEIDFKYDQGEFGNVIPEGWIENADIVIASNFQVYSYIMYKLPGIMMKTINLEAYCRD